MYIFYKKYIKGGVDVEEKDKIMNGIRKIIGDKEIVWGIAKTSDINGITGYCCGIVIAQKYTEFLSYKKYSEEKYNEVLKNTKDVVDKKINELKAFFDEYKIDSYIPPLSQRSESDLVAPVSFKYLAVNSGLGWIGKSSLLITKEFGPRVRLGVILVNYRLDCGTPIVKSLCGNCEACVNACPWNFIENKLWNIYTERKELIDFHSCNRKRSEYINENKTASRKHNCGYCLLVCPYGCNEHNK